MVSIVDWRWQRTESVNLRTIEITDLKSRGKICWPYLIIKILSEDFCSDNMEYIYFFFLFLLWTTKNPRHYIQNKYKRTLNSEKNQPDWLRAQESEEWQRGEFAEFPSFLLRKSQLWSWRNQQSGNTNRCRRKEKSRQNPAFSSLKTKKGAA